ncbi:DivIVA domain-containing protein [Ornithinimicrobium sp. F0845]|uniref:DivIVA domain-containing protein n=1 Tax=Ornithinimicrobium sp. F0845 TaxID=2926412 RepID=UPI001FF30F9F|nr:DivIVA domain-containing protein [Ornithinimicrobium sp. F0845]MCK0112816.1 DivIVA domain-containing protein [Ornithinimicrobium sp. F0845]
MTDPAGRPTFRTAGFLKAGYATDDVDAFVDQLFTALATGAPVPDILGARFATRRGGYDMEEVDNFLDEVTVGLGGTEPTEEERAQEQQLRDQIRDLKDRYGR